nr:immunoglobulin heavy chain junction region [Macaca mulatta]MOV40320.1 immunoglobulin heavy chain junction region [Macaca mulatta]MOV40325.1 immunoglobulin heavy chain junction region [Macaca mulatta]MOV40359.1 immunoglobulin heavy chain junction region [Macaca mulatta]MOV41386.1 immunoglobulin heavy chain junction region [Macaca mulatta]
CAKGGLGLGYYFDYW